MCSRAQVTTTILWVISLLLHYSSAYELQDTIHTLKEENLHLHHQLENLTHALRDLKHLLTEGSKVSGGRHDAEFLGAWKEWSQHGISAETHKVLEQAFCLAELQGAAQTPVITPGLLLLTLFPSVILLLLG